MQKLSLHGSIYLYKDSSPLFGIEFTLYLNNFIPYQKELYRRYG